MKITLESTDLIVKVGRGNTPPEYAVECRLWEGETSNGIPITCLIARVAVNSNHDQSEFERQLKETPPPITLGDLLPRILAARDTHRKN